MRTPQRLVYDDVLAVRTSKQTGMIMPAKRHNQYSNDPWLEIRISVERLECAHRPSDASLALLNRCRDQV